MLSENWLPTIRQVIRDYVPLDDDEIDLVIAGELLGSSDTEGASVWSLTEVPPLTTVLADLAVRRENDVEHVLAQMIRAAADSVRCPLRPDQQRQIAAAVQLVEMIVGAAERRRTPGTRLLLTSDIVETGGAMAGASEVGLREIIFGVRLVLRPLTRFEDAVLRYAIDPERRRGSWKGAAFLRSVEGGRGMYDLVLTEFSRSGVLARSGSRGAGGYRYELSPEARRLINRTDPGLELYRAMWPKRIVPDRRAMGLK